MNRTDILDLLPRWQREAHKRHERDCQSFINRHRITIVAVVTYSDGTTEIVT